MKVAIKDLGEIITGNTPSKKDESFWNSDDICFVKPDGIADEGITLISNSNEYLSENARKKARVVSKDAVFVTCIGSIGKIGIASDGDYAFNQQINVVIPNEKVLPRYLAYNLLFSKPRLEAIANAPVVPIINKTQFGNFMISIEESTDKQEQIVSTLDKLSGIICSRKAELEELDNLIKARFVEMFGDVILNDKNWQCKAWADVLTIVNGRNQKDVEAENGDYLICGSGGPMSRATNYLTNENSVIIGRKGNINKPILMREKFWNVDTAFGLEPDTMQIMVEYLYLYCVLFDFEKLNKAVTIPSLTKTDLLKIEMPIPNFALQKKFAEFCAQVDKSKVVALKVA